MSTTAQIADAFAAYLHAILPGRMMIEGNVGEGAAPSVPACIWRLTSIEPDDFPRVEYVGDDQLLHSVTPLTFRVTCLGGPDTIDACFRVAAGLRLSQRTSDLFKVCGFWGTQPVTDLSALETGTMRQRAEMLVVLSADITMTSPREWMDQVDLRVEAPAKAFDETVTVQGPT